MTSSYDQIASSELPSASATAAISGKAVSRMPLSFVRGACLTCHYDSQEHVTHALGTRPIKQAVDARAQLVRLASLQG